MLKLLQILSFIVLRIILVRSKSDNKPPYFLSGGDFSSFSIPENFQVKTPVYKLKGFDPEGKKLTYSISGPYFSVERETGIVKLIKELDRESQNEVETIITITDEAENNEEPNTVSLRRLISIRDVNDFSPSFLGRPYSANVLETSKIGHIIETTPITVIDKDEGENSEVTISCHHVENHDKESPCDYFDVVTIKRGEGNYTVELRLQKAIDYETRKSYALTIIAKDKSRDNPLYSNATININVLDAQDQPPLFYGSPYSTTLLENLGPNVNVLAINASDGDFGNPNDVILTLEREKFGYFKLLKSGKGQAMLTTSEIPIDRENFEIFENGGYYTFFVRATEVYKNLTLGDSSLTTITINVKDVDDNIPEFNESYFNLTIPENLENNMALPKLSIQVSDRDGVIENSKFNLTISNVENAEGLFDISPKESHGRTQVIVRVKNSSRLDYDVKSNAEKTFIFEIIATVNFIPLAKTTVEVHLEGINDHFPAFEQSNYRIHVSENVELGSQISNISASDLDVGVFGQLKYILRGFGSENFETNSEKGGLYVKNNLDYEQQKSYSLSLIAKDYGGREANANIFIDVIDVNDNYPQFEMTEYYRSVREGSKYFEPQFTIKAHDADGVTQGNGRVEYFIESENSISGHIFGIDNETGEIFMKAAVHSSDTFDGNYELMICARDFGNPQSLKNYTKVIIRVGSENQRPIFQGHLTSSHESILGPPFYRMSIYENADRGSNLTQIQAIDPDGDNKLLRYRITEPSDSFMIDEISGVIKISPYARLDRDLSDTYSILVHAIDSGMPSETSTVTIKVKILDVNNKPPKFRKVSYTAYVPERNKKMEVLRVEALDSDLDAKLKYSIIQPVYATTKAGFKLNPTNFDYKSIFKINEDTGSILLMRNLESSGLYSVTLTVKVVDVNAMNSTIQQYDTTEVILYIQSFKESGPIFLNDGWNQIDKKLKLKVNEEMSVSSTVIEFEAIDPYSNEQIYDFEMEPQEYFELQENKLLISKVIDYETIESTHFILDIKAISRDSFSVAHLSIEIQNINDNSPIFDKNQYKAAVLESIKENDVILKVKAIDNDVIRNENDKFTGYSHITYSLTGVNSGLFSIDKDGGEIRLAKNQSLDREKLSFINFQVLAEDCFGKPLTMKKKSFVNVSIEILDVNDNAPKLLNAMKNNIIVTVLSESSKPNTEILKLESLDPDEGLAAEVRYEMINEGELKNLLALNSNTGELKTAQFLTGRGRSEPYEISIRALDNGHQIPKQRSLFTDQIIHIFIGDTFQNDGIPYFVSPQDEEANVFENSPIGTKVYQVIAKDHDDPSTPSGMLRYRIQNDIDDAQYFSIEPLTGVVTTLQILDREMKSKYNVIVEVTDSGIPIQMATKVLKINVIDVDDELPLFVRDINAPPIELSILEEQSTGVILGNITAIDKDIGENGAIDYEIIDGNELEFFKLIVANNSALITTTRPIDREEHESFLLTIKCFKMATQWKRLKNVFAPHNSYNSDDLSEIQVAIYVLDIDDHVLEFEKKNFLVGIRNTIPINTIIYRVQAYDRDIANTPIIYQISNTTYVSQYNRKDSKFKEDLMTIFELNNQTGEILLAKSVSDYVDGYFVINFLASNNQYSHSEAIIKIFIIRDKSIMKFVFGKAPSPHTPSMLNKFAEKLQSKLNGTELEIMIFDAQVLSKPEKALEYTSSSACFQLLRSGNSLTAQETKNILNSEEMKNQLRETYLEYFVDSIEVCSFGNKKVSYTQSTLMTSSGNWLVLLAFFVLLASLISTLVAFCLFKRSKNAVPHMTIIKSPILHQRISNPDIYNNDGTVEPIYTIM